MAQNPANQKPDESVSSDGTLTDHLDPDEQLATLDQKLVNTIERQVIIMERQAKVEATMSKMAIISSQQAKIQATQAKVENSLSSTTGQLDVMESFETNVRDIQDEIIQLRQSVPKRGLEDLGDDATPPTKKVRVSESYALNHLAFDVVTFLCECIAVTPSTLSTLLKNKDGDRPSYEVMARNKTPFNVEELCESLERHVLPLLHTAREVARIIVKVVSTQPLPGITEDEMNTIEDIYVQAYGSGKDEDSWSFFREECTSGGAGCKVIYGLFGSMLHHRFSYSFDAGLFVHKLSVDVKAHNGGSSQPTRYLIREATYSLWDTFMELYNQDLGFTRRLIGISYKGKKISPCLLELLLGDQSDLGNTEVDKVKDTIKHGFPVLWQDG